MQLLFKRLSRLSLFNPQRRFFYEEAQLRLRLQTGLLDVSDWWCTLQHVEQAGLIQQEVIRINEQAAQGFTTVHGRVDTLDAQHTEAYARRAAIKQTPRSLERGCRPGLVAASVIFSFQTWPGSMLTWPAAFGAQAERCTQYNLSTARDLEVREQLHGLGQDCSTAQAHADELDRALQRLAIEARALTPAAPRSTGWIMIAQVAWIHELGRRG